jgi:hypothetical protein
VQFRSRFQSWLVLLGLVVPALLVANSPVVHAQATPQPEGLQFTPLVPSVSTPPRWFRGTDGQVHLVYELLLINAFPVPVELTTVDVLNVDSGETLETFTGDTLAAATSLLISPSNPTTSLPAGSVAVVWIDAPVASPELLPDTLTHHLTVTVPPGLPVPETVTQVGGEASVDLRPPVELSPPLAGARWAAVGSCCDGPHRRALQPVDGALHLAQRFAIDFNRLDAENRSAAGDPSLTSSSPSYGQPVLAVADAVVVIAIDRFQDQVPYAPTQVPLEEVEGNRVILDLGDGRYALYAHLKPGSVTVREGEQVQPGQVIGEVGNSGNSSGPHLHFHVMDSAAGLAADGMPYVFTAFDLMGTAPPLEEILVLDQEQAPLPIDTQGAGPRENELPLGRDVISFPDVEPAG